jgi:hypothetical protein
VTKDLERQTVKLKEESKQGKEKIFHFFFLFVKSMNSNTDLLESKAVVSNKKETSDRKHGYFVCGK